MSSTTADGNLDIYKFVKPFVISAESTKKCQASSEVLELIAAAFRAIPLAGAFVDKSITTTGKKVRRKLKRHEGIKIQTAINLVSPEELNPDDKFRVIMISVAIKIYLGFKHQLENVYFNFNGNESREVALQILAEFAGQRCLQQLVDTGSVENLHKSLLQSSVMSKIKLSTKRTELDYHLEDAVTKKAFKLSITNFEFFQKWIPTYLFEDLSVSALLEERKQRPTPGNYVWVNKSSKKKRGANCCYYLRPRFSWEIDGVQECDKTEIDITSSCRTLEEFTPLDQDNWNLVHQILIMLHHDEHYDLNLATFSIVKSIGSNVELLTSKVDGIKCDVEILNTLTKEFKMFFETKAREVESLRGYECARLAQMLLKDYDIIEKGGNFSERSIVTEDRVIDIFKELRSRLGMPDATDSLISMDKNPFNVGSVLMINNIFEGTHMHRRGAEEDSARFSKFFKDVLGINVLLSKDVSSIDLPKSVQSFKEKCIENNSSFSIVIIMSHGSHGDELLMHDERPIKFFSDVLDQFNRDSFPEFMQKPKLFFIQGCSDVDPGYCREYKATMSCKKIRNYFIGFASQQGCHSYRNPIQGSFYIQALLESFKKFWKIKDVAEMHNYASQAVAEMTTRNAFAEKSQHPWTYNGLRLPLYFV